MTWTTWQHLSVYMRRPWRRLLALAALSTFGGVAEAAVLVIVVNAALPISNGTTNVPTTLPILGVEATTGSLLWIAAVLSIALVVAHATVARLTADLSAEVLESSRRRAISAYVAASWPVQSRDREGALQETISTLATQSSVLALSFANGLAASLSLAALMLTAALVDAVVMAAVVVVGLLLFAALRPISQLTNRRANDVVTANSMFAEDVSRLATMAMELRLFGVAVELESALDDANRAVSQHWRRSRFATQFGSTLYRDLSMIFLVGAVAALGVGDTSHVVQIGAVVLLIVRALAYATSLQSTLQGISEQSPNLLALERRLEHLRQGEERQGSTALEVFEELRFVNVSYEYVPGEAALRDFNLNIPAGQVLGIVGPSGGGKTTLLQVLLRLRRPTRGQVLVDGCPYEEIDDTVWPRFVALVPQEPKLMEATIADNIRFLRPGITLEQIESAADAAHVGDEIRRLPDGFDTMLGPRGSGLSGGQKQRVAIARALIGSPRMLVLDEPTSALDGHSERRLQDTIRDLKGSTTIVIVAHRLSTLDVCDRLITIKHGVIANDEPVVSTPRPSTSA